MQRRNSVLIASLMALQLPLWASGCGQDLPPSLPTTQVMQRMLPRTGLIELVVGDKTKAKKVRDLHLEMEQLFLNEARDGAAAFQKLSNPVQDPMTDDELRALMKERVAARRKTFMAYVALQLEMREHVSAEEFAKLNRIR